MTNPHAEWLREHAAWLDASMGYVAIPAARMRDTADEIERLAELLRLADELRNAALNYANDCGLGQNTWLRDRINDYDGARRTK